MLEVKTATFAYPGLHMTFDLNVPRGSFTAITGPSGGGKSSLLALIAGFEKPLSGSICIAGVDVTHAAPSARPLSMIFQDHNLFAHLDVFTNVALGLSPSLRIDEKDRDQIMSALAHVGLQGMSNRKPGDLSGGERQRAALARALIRSRPLLLLDEPFTALGPAQRQEMLRLVTQIHRARGLTTLLVTHDPLEARAAASHMAFLQSGRITACLPTRDFFKAGKVPALQGYLGNRRHG